MKKIMKWFKSLPRELKIILALAGLGSGPAAFYFLLKLFPGRSKLELILWIVGILLAVILVVFLISWIFNRGKRKRASRMASDLADDSLGGPQSMDVSAAIKANNEKFFSAIRDMKKNIGINVYDLPWYIVMGDSGCGKTKLINEGGLTFSTGKPEGYQLGTLNYNWWFTEDAIFVDMAGRLCNPQDDGDRREWTAFLDTIAKGRKGFPINGAFVCVSAEHLLQDPPEKQEEYANVALERLRDLQTKLGVTFATYLVITKCDKILGFMQFFDRASHDITIKNQIFGWSKPGAFNELYDPEHFKEDFNALYGRLHELRLRRLNDDEQEIDLGLAYSYPEEFRRFYEPLQIYVRTLFPYIKNPRAVKNLIFRGVYFTSATQEGELILKNLTERLGQSAADQFAPLDDLYPNKRPHFIKDLMFRKVFPEHGLVFRNEQQVVRNKKLNRLLKIGTSVLAVVLFAGFWWSASAFNRVVVNPRNYSEEMRQRFESHAKEGEAWIEPEAALRQAVTVATHMENIRTEAFAAKVLSIGVHWNRPIEGLERIRAGLIEVTLIQALRDVEAALRTGKALQSSNPSEVKAYRDALTQYLRWVGCRHSKSADALTDSSFKALCAVLSGSKSITHADHFFEQAEWYFSSIAREEHLRRNPAKLITRAGLEPGSVALAAIGHIYDYYSRNYASLSEHHNDESVAEWMRLHQSCLDAKKHFDALLATSAQAVEVETLEALDRYRDTFVTEYDAFAAAVDGLVWQGPGLDAPLLDIPTLSDLLWAQRQEWLTYEAQLQDALGVCGASDSEISKAVRAIHEGDGNHAGLDKELWMNLKSAGMVKANSAYGDEVYADEKSFASRITEVNDLFPEVLLLTQGDGSETGDRLTAVKDVQAVRAFLKPARDGLYEFKAAIPQDLNDQRLAAWNEALDQHLRKTEPSGSNEFKGADLDVGPDWEREQVENLRLDVDELIRQGAGTRLLRTIEARLKEVQAIDSWGIAEMWPIEQRYREVRAPYTITMLQKPNRRRDRGREAREPVPDQERSFGLRRRRRRSSGEAPPRAGAKSSKRDRLMMGRELAGHVPNCATHDFLSDVANELMNLLALLDRMQGAFLDEGDQAENLTGRCRTELSAAAQSYFRAYVRAWAQAYERSKLKSLDRLKDEMSNWDRLTRAMGSGSRQRGRLIGKVSAELEEKQRWILRAIPYAMYDEENGWWDSEDDPNYELAADEVSRWMYDALKEGWPVDSLGEFAETPLSVGSWDAGEPWDVIAGDFTQAWEQLADQIAGAGAIPKRYEREVPKLTPIEWGRFRALRQDHQLMGERITERLIGIEQRAQRLLNARLTETLVGLERQQFGSKKRPDPGWPYLPGEPYTLRGLNTVGFQPFLGFLQEVKQAEDALKPLESNLPNDLAGYMDRHGFYRQCDAWFDFLGLEADEGGTPDDLKLKLSYGNPFSPPGKQVQVDDTCQFAADRILLNLGSVQVSQNYALGSGGVLSLACLSDRQKPFEFTWDWDAAGSGHVTVALDQPLQGVTIPEAITLGTHSPLAFCAYLEKYGQPEEQRKKWYVTHVFPVSGVENTKRCGQEIEFEFLGQPLPKPIRELRKISVSETQR